MPQKTIITVYGKEVRVQGRFLRIGSFEGEKHTFLDSPEVVVDGLRRSRVRVDIFTFLQRVSDTSPKYPYSFEYDNLAVLPISTFEHWWDNQIRSYPRNRARQAQKKGVTFREVPFGETLIKGICGIYNETPVRQGKAFPHYGMTPEEAQGYAGTFLDQSVYIGAFLGDVMIGFTKLVMDENRSQACMVHILSMIQHNDKAPTNALIAQAVRYCAEHKVSYLVYERFTYGNKQGDSLSHFKEVNGFQRVDLPRYYVPITNFGRVSLGLGLHHRLADRVPASIAAKFRELRKAWYSRDVRKLTES
jgi:hypothetical protein